MESREEYSKFLLEAGIDLMVKMEQFAKWLRNFFYLNQKLHEQHNSSDQLLFYIHLNALITTEGLGHIENVLTSLEQYEHRDDNKIKWYNDLRDGLLNLKSQLTNSEFEFVQYKRHNVCHIFQEGYNKKLERDGKIKRTISGKNLDQLHSEFRKILIEHGSDEAFDIYLNKKLYPSITALHNTLNQGNKAD